MELHPYKNRRLIQQILRKGRPIAQTITEKMSAYWTTEVIVWDDHTWWQTHVPSHDTYKSGPRADPDLTGMRQLEWREECPFNAALYVLDHADEVERDASEADTPELRKKLLASVDKRIKLVNGELNWKELQADYRTFVEKERAEERKRLGYY